MNISYYSVQWNGTYVYEASPANIITAALELAFTRSGRWSFIDGKESPLDPRRSNDDKSSIGPFFADRM